MPRKVNGIIGIVNNNPFNVKSPKSGFWEGQIDEDDYKHAIFCSLDYAVRAAVRDILGDIDVDGLNTLRRLMAEYAPVSDPKANNNPLRYAEFLGRKIGLGIDDRLDVCHPGGKVKNRERLIKLLQALLEYEVFSGYAIPVEHLNNGILLYERKWG